MRGATRSRSIFMPVIIAYFNPRSSCEERRVRRAFQTAARPISIHAPHARSDSRYYYSVDIPDISIHAPHARSDWQAFKDDKAALFLFQSTLLMRGATASPEINLFVMNDFNPRSSCEERHVLHHLVDLRDGISIHAPHARSDGGVAFKTANRIFQSTLLMRGATWLP